MIKIVKKVLGVALMSFMLFSMVGMSQASANNYRDTNFGFSFRNKQVSTDARLKQDTSKLYMKCTSIVKDTSYTAHAGGCKSTVSSAVDCSRGYTYTFSKKGQYKYMTSWVKEDGYKYARILASPNYSFKYAATGVWSPDNVNRY